MKNLNLSWKDGIEDTTGLILSFSKALGLAVTKGVSPEAAEDITATSGFAFRMWVDEKELNPKAMVSWKQDKQKSWVENGGLTCNYVGRDKGQEDLGEEKRKEIENIIIESIDKGIPAVVWKVGGEEWGLITGYDDDNRNYNTLLITGDTKNMSYDSIGNDPESFLSVLTVTGKNEKTENEILMGTLKIAVEHLKGEEDCNYVTGLDAYPALMRFFNESFDDGLVWNMEYHLGTFSALKYYAYRYFNKYEVKELKNIYQIIYQKWKAAFDHIRYKDISDEGYRSIAAGYLKEAYEAEKKALGIMENLLQNNGKDSVAEQIGK